MIRYRLQCAEGHQFDQWFDNSAACDVQLTDQALACPDCGSTHLRKAMMAPNVAKTSAKAPPPAPSCPVSGCGGGMCPMAGGM